MSRVTDSKILLIVTVAMIVIGWSCEKATTLEEPAPNLTQFQGTWEGSISFVRAGDCQINHRDTLLIPNTRLIWTVDSDGLLTAGEDHFITTWSGKIWPSYAVELVKINLWSQGGSTGCECVNADTTEYLGTIVRNAENAWELNLTSTENWCPGNNARFVVRYELTKL
jgi:hypothetical protein